MNVYASVRLPGALASSEREAVTRKLRSAGVAATSWSIAGGRTYALLALSAEAALASAEAYLPAEAVFAMPPRVVLRIVPRRSADVASLAEALAGPGGFTGIVASATESDAVIIEADVRTTPLSSIVSLIDAVVGRRERVITCILPLGDDDIACLAGALLGDPTPFDRNRLIETHVAAVLAEAHA